VDTFTTTLSIAEPPDPVQVIVYVVDDVIALGEKDPLVPAVPPHPPEAIQEVAFVEVQVKETKLPLDTVEGPSEPLTFKSTVGDDAPTTVITDGVLMTVPLEAVMFAVPALTAVIKPLELTVATDVLLETGMSVAMMVLPNWSSLIDDSCWVLPMAKLTVDGDKVIVVRTGVELLLLVTATVAVAVAEPPVPAQVIVYVCELVRTPVLIDPDVGSADEKLPEILHDVALVEDQTIVVELPEVTDAWLVERVTVGWVADEATVTTTGALMTVPLEAVMFAVPALTAVTSPLEVTVATAVLLDVGKTVVLIELPDWSSLVDDSCWVWPMAKLIVNGDKVIVVRTGVELPEAVLLATQDCVVVGSFTEEPQPL
jgi:hypothetical protein